MSKVFTATAISPGLGLGQLQRCNSYRISTPNPDPAQLLAQECLALQGLLQRQDLPQDQRQLLEADHLMLSDPELLEALQQRLGQGDSLAQVLRQLFAEHAEVLASLPDPELAKRANDMHQLGERLARQSLGQNLQLPQILPEPTILAVPDLTAAEFIQLPKENLQGVVLGQGSATDHLAILLRSAGIPALVLTDACGRLSSGPTLIDGDRGQLTLGQNEEELQLFTQALARWQRQQRLYQQGMEKPAHTADGDEIWLGANIGTEEEASQVLEFGLDGIGLLRTEFLYMAEGGWPDSERQLIMYRAIAEQLDGKPLVIRTFDFGADKNLPGLAQEEPNPALGLRAIRLGLQQPERLRQQLRAIVRLADEFPVRLLLPMISLPEEVEMVRSLLDQVQNECRLAPRLPVGVMIETPAAAMSLDLLAPLVDFASIGSNDLAQYCLAADRLHARLTPHYPALSPPVLRLLQHICQQAQVHKLPLSICGELGADLKAIDLLLAMGLRSFSIPARQCGPVKHRMAQYRDQWGQILLDQALACASNDALSTLLNDCVNNGLSATIEAISSPPAHRSD
ncbi:phosphoenolpyruvate--protein phosphotransferase [Ferrimonas marina]|uniref:Phosphoenolpyruvate-protein phosphotransferase n=1 Tax=Ferrimonas marina TaxID=299255 RepID=A0A1M5YV09_9GAMM|nr:phosphoenolpyruvate--protein phosphotransferase [Ferrimonas marina]SHI15906.1 phosphotransferase system, enzyme I, PtsI [Ferrimonas marina]